MVTVKSSTCKTIKSDTYMQTYFRGE
uniref:Uncharacterized protein n=1 Tax=Arundo donax TaxID=35708 RepID=A0A0A9HN98_ARUDO